MGPYINSCGVSRPAAKRPAPPGCLTERLSVILTLILNLILRLIRIPFPIPIPIPMPIPLLTQIIIRQGDAEKARLLLLL